MGFSLFMKWLICLMMWCSWCNCGIRGAILSGRASGRTSHWLGPLRRRSSATSVMTTVTVPFSCHWQIWRSTSNWSKYATCMTLPTTAMLLSRLVIKRMASLWCGWWLIGRVAMPIFRSFNKVHGSQANLTKMWDWSLPRGKKIEWCMWAEPCSGRDMHGLNSKTWNPANTNFIPKWTAQTTNSVFARIQRCRCTFWPKNRQTSREVVYLGKYWPVLRCAATLLTTNSQSRIYQGEAPPISNAISAWPILDTALPLSIT